jgi:hypothetical protein
VVVVIWKVAKAGIAKLVQRLGRAARGAGEEGMGVIFAERKFSDAARAEETAKAAAKQLGQQSQKKATVSNKRAASTDVQDDSQEKRQTTSGSTSMGPSEPAVVLQAAQATGTTRSVLVQGSSRGRLTASWRMTKAPKWTLCPDVERLINAKERGLGCRRHVINVAFKNDTCGECTSKAQGCLKTRKALTGTCRSDFDHLACDPDSITGCPRCAPQTPTVCCDICQPRIFDTFFMTPAPPPKRKPQISNVKDFEYGSKDQQLVEALQTWRNDTGMAVLGRNLYRLGSAKLFMHDDVIARIVGLARKHRICNADSFAHEVSWNSDYHEQYAHAILEIVAKVHGAPAADVPTLPSPSPMVPGPAPSVTPMQTLHDVTNEQPQPAQAPTKPRRAPPQCGKCHEIGHIRESESGIVSIYCL